MSSNRHRVLVIGVGSIGERHTRCFLATGRAEVAIVETNDALRRTIAERYSIAQVWGTLDEAMRDRFDAAVIATPANLHIPMATRLAAAGVHLLIEKPLALALDGIDELKKTIAANDIVAAVAYVNRANPALAAMQREIASGRFGRPVQIVVTCGQHFPTFRPAYRNIYYTRHATGGGAIQDAITHMIDVGRWFVGPITRLVADAAHQVLEGVDVEDSVNVLTRQGEGGKILGSYALNQHQAPNEMTISVICDKGTVRYEAHEARWRWMSEPSSAWHDEPVPEARERDTVFTRQAAAFLDAVERKAPPLCSLDDGIAALRANLAMLKSSADRSWHDL